MDIRVYGFRSTKAESENPSGVLLRHASSIILNDDLQRGLRLPARDEARKLARWAESGKVLDRIFQQIEDHLGHQSSIELKPGRILKSAHMNLKGREPSVFKQGLNKSNRRNNDVGVNSCLLQFQWNAIRPNPHEIELLHES